jgi:hypothetical protein
MFISRRSIYVCGNVGGGVKIFGGNLGLTMAITDISALIASSWIFF